MRQQSGVRGTILAGILFLGVVFCLSACQNASEKSEKDLLNTIQERGVLIAGVKYDSKPFGYLDTDGVVKGYDVDLIREIAGRLLGNKNAVTFQPVLSSTRVLALNADQVDIVAATMTITPEREKLIDFSTRYYQAGQAVMVPKSSLVTSLLDLQDKTILYVFGSTSEKAIRKRLPNAHYLGYKSAVDAFSSLKAKRGDAMTTDDTILMGFLSKSCDFKLLPERLEEEPYGLGIKQDSLHHRTESFKVAVNKILADLEKDGTLQALNNKWVKAYQQQGGTCGQHS